MPGSPQSRLPAANKSAAAQKGVTLIEVLIALVILSIGLVGLATLQTVGLRANHSAYLRSQAVIMAYNVVDRMRANRPAATSGAYDIALGDSASGGGVPEADLADWKARLDRLLPVGDGSVAVSSGEVTVVVRYDDSRGEGEPTLLRIETGL